MAYPPLMNPKTEPYQDSSNSLNFILILFITFVLVILVINFSNVNQFKNTKNIDALEIRMGILESHQMDFSVQNRADIVILKQEVASLKKEVQNLKNK